MFLRRAVLTVVVLATAFLSACYPLELQTSHDGQVIIPRPEGVLLFHPSTGVARQVPAISAGTADAFAALTADGDWLVRATRPYNGVEDPGSATTIWLTNLRTTDTDRELATFENGTFLQTAPRGGKISWSFVSGEQHDGVSENMPQLHLYDIASGVTVQVANNVSVTHRWLPDGSGIVYLRTEGKDTDGRVGSLCVWNLATKKERRIARVNDAEWFDLAPDGEEVILSAKGMAAIEGRRRSRGDGKALYAVNVREGLFRRLEYDAEHARYSPGRGHVAFLKDRALWITERDLELPENPILRGVTHEIDNGTKVHLSWANDNEVLVITRQPRFGLAGMSPELLLVNAVTGASRNLQADLDRLARTTAPGDR